MIFPLIELIIAIASIIVFYGGPYWGHATFFFFLDLSRDKLKTVAIKD